MLSKRLALGLCTTTSSTPIFHLNSLNRSNQSNNEKEYIHEIRDDKMEVIPSEVLGSKEGPGKELSTEIHGPLSLQFDL